VNDQIVAGKTLFFLPGEKKVLTAVNKALGHSTA
jgi:hypothetical protein